MRRLLILPLALAAALAGAATRIVQDQCGPFTDVPPLFCPYVLEAYYTGITAGTSPTTFSPDIPITRGQAAVFTTKGLNQALARSSRRAALGQWWTNDPFDLWLDGLGTTPLPSPPSPVSSGAMACDGTDIWVGGSDSISRFRASDGRLLGTWTIERWPTAILVAMGRIFVAGFATSGPGALYVIDPAQSAGAAVKVADIPSAPLSLAFDGGRLWTANVSGVSIVTPSSTLPWAVTTVSNGFQYPAGILFDGRNTWVTDSGPCALFQLDASGAIVRTVSLGSQGCYMKSPTFDGQNILVPNVGLGLEVVRPADGAVIENLLVGGNVADKAVFDGERILVVSNGAGQSTPPSLTLLRAADFSVIQYRLFSPISGPSFGGGATDGLNFWITLDAGTGPVLARY